MAHRWIPLGLVLAFAVGCGSEATDGDGADPAEAGAVGPDEIVAAYDRALDYYRSQIGDDGAVSMEMGGQSAPNVGLTALAASVIAMRPGGIRTEDRAALDRALDYLVASQRDNGGIYGQHDSPNYATSVAVMALAETGRERDGPTLDRAVAFLKGMQFDEDGGPEHVVPVDPDHPDYGGMGYGSSRTPDLSNTHYALEGLRAGGVGEDDEVYEKVVKFLERNQNLSEYNPGGVAYLEDPSKTTKPSDDGGAGYMPADSKAGVVENEDGTVTLISYGSMTYALLKCYIYAGVERDDPRVQGALRWIRRNWTWDENPGFQSAEDRQQGLYYYYGVAGLALRAYGEPIITDANGVEHDWRAELAAKVTSLQRDDGTWINENDRWWEDKPKVATAHALLALATCVPE